jgi:outer membrane receptor for ferrienterochelin and colicins
MYKKSTFKTYISCSLLFILIAAVASSGQTTGNEGQKKSPGDCSVKGVISDPSGATIPNATIVLEPGEESILTSEDGAFCFDEVDPSTSVYRVTAPGFEEKRGNIRISSGTPVEIDLVMLPETIKSEITVTAATRTVKKLEEVPVRTEVVLPEIIEMTASSNLADAVEFSSGIRVENNCQNCNFSQIRMLGLKGPYTQILFNGQPAMSSLAQVYGVEHIPSRMVDRIEIVKGGGSAIYGPGSVGGVLNVISHIPLKTSGYLMSRQGWMTGTPNTELGASIDWVSDNRDSAVTAFGQAKSVTGLDVDGDGYTEVAERDFLGVGALFRQNFLKGNANLTIDFNHVREDRRGGDRLHLPEHEANIAESIDSHRYAGGVGWHHTINTDFDYQLAFSYAHTDRDTYYGAGMDPNAYGESRNPLWVVDSQFNHYFRSHIFSWGGQVSGDGIEDTQPAYDRFYDEIYHDAGFFVQDDWFIVPSVEVVCGIRIDKHTEIDKVIFSPRVALMWSPKPDLNIRGSVATGFLPPQVFNEDLHIEQVGGAGQVIRNADDLKEERSITFTGGLEWLPDWGISNGLLEINAFYTGLNDIFNIVENDNPLTEEAEFSRINSGKAKVYGAEINLGYAIGRILELQVGYVEQRSRYNEAEPDFGSKDFFRTPDRYVLFTTVYRNPELADFFFGWRYTGEMKVPHYTGYIPEDRLETSSGHWILDASVSRSFPFVKDSKIIFTIGGKNLADYYQDDLDQGPDRDAGYVWGPRFPRSVYFSTSVEF